MGKGLGHLAAQMKDFTKNWIEIKILKIPQINDENSISDHLYLEYVIK